MAILAGGADATLPTRVLFLFLFFDIYSLGNLFEGFEAQ